MDDGNLYVRKTSGAVEPFSEDKLLASLRRAGASEPLADSILERLRREVPPEISTRRLYRRAFRMLRQEAREVAARYRLKRALLQLGPTGYPFERLWAAVLEAEGFETRCDVVLPGACVSHEVDVVGTREGRRVLAECKFHSHLGRRTDLKVALYVHARWLDLQRAADDAPEAFWLVTNTKFTTDAIRYGTCVGLKLCAWSYPAEGSLQQRIEALGLFPVTCLSGLKGRHRRMLLDAGVVLCRQLEPKHLDRLSLSRADRADLERELEELALTRLPDS